MQCRERRRSVRHFAVASFVSQPASDRRQCTKLKPWRSLLKGQFLVFENSCTAPRIVPSIRTESQTFKLKFSSVWATLQKSQPQKTRRVRASPDRPRSVPPREL